MLTYYGVDVTRKELDDIEKIQTEFSVFYRCMKT